jgi:predicted Zn-dependent protease
VTDDLRELVAASEAHAEQGSWGPRALDVNRRLLDLQPGATGVRLRYANCLVAAGRLEEGLRELRRVAGEASSERQRRIAARRLAEIEERDRAARTASFAAAHRRAIGLREAAKGEVAVIWHERAVELADTDVERAVALASWASTMRGLRLFREAREKAESAVAADPSPRSNLAGHAALIATLVDIGTLAEAGRRADALLRVHPRDPVALATAGRAFRELGKQTNDESLRRKASACFLAAGGAERN